MRNQRVLLRTGFLAFLLLVLPLMLPPAQAAARTAAVPANSLVFGHDATQRTLRFPANALNYEKTSTILTQVSNGIRWQSNASGPAYLIVPRPLDWDGVSEVSFSLYFLPTTNTTGKAASFFIRPRAFNPDEIFMDAIGITSDPVPVSTSNQVREQVITIPAASFGTKELWVITIQRNSTAETYHDDVILTAVGLTYHRQSPPVGQGFLGLPANALNYDKNSTILSQYATGIRWQANYQSSAFLTVPRPPDWDGVSDVSLSLYFYPMTAGSGEAEFFIRPRAYNLGNYWGDATSMESAPVSISAVSQVREQVFTIPASKFYDGDRELWAITIQRVGVGETYTGDVVLMAVGLNYTRQGQLPPAGVLAFPANALNFDKASTILTQYSTGIRWQSDFLNPAFLAVPRPPDWDGVSDVQLSLYFYPLVTDVDGGIVHFFIRPRAFDPGDQWVDAIDLSGDPVAVMDANQIWKQVFTIPASRFGTKELWVITIQREGSEETYTGDVILTAVELSYTGWAQKVFLPVVIK